MLCVECPIVSYEALIRVDGCFSAAPPLAGQEFGDREPDAPGAADDDGTPSAQLASSWPNFIASMFQ